MKFLLLIPVKVWGARGGQDWFWTQGREPPLAGRFQETGSKPRIWLMSFPVCYCASLNASVLDPREKPSFISNPSSRHICLFQEKPRLHVFSAEWQNPNSAWLQSWVLGVITFLHVTFYLWTMPMTNGSHDQTKTNILCLWCDIIIISLYNQKQTWPINDKFIY